MTKKSYLAECDSLADATIFFSKLRQAGVLIAAGGLAGIIVQGNPATFSITSSHIALFTGLSMMLISTVLSVGVSMLEESLYYRAKREQRSDTSFSTFFNKRTAGIATSSAGAGIISYELYKTATSSFNPLLMTIGAALLIAGLLWVDAIEHSKIYYEYKNLGPLLNRRPSIKAQKDYHRGEGIILAGEAVAAAGAGITLLNKPTPAFNAVPTFHQLGTQVMTAGVGIMLCGMLLSLISYACSLTIDTEKESRDEERYIAKLSAPYSNC